MMVEGFIADGGKAMPFDDAFRARLRDLLVWRRDVRRFRRDPLPAGSVERLIGLACLAPSVGLSEPWRFVIVDDPAAIAEAYVTGRGWVSILEPAAVGTILEVPPDWKFIAYLCLGFAQSEDDSPDLARKGWEKRQPFPVVLRR